MAYKLSQAQKHKRMLQAREYRKSDKFHAWNKEHEKTPNRLAYHKKFDKERSQEPARKKYLALWVKDYQREKFDIPKDKWENKPYKPYKKKKKK